MSRERSKARRSAVQAIYQWQLTPKKSAAEIIGEFLEERPVKKVDIQYFSLLVTETILFSEKIEGALGSFLDRPLQQVDMVERAIMRVAVYELLFKDDVPFKVVIDEAVEATKLFGSINGHKFVNGIIDQVAKKYRASEFDELKEKSV